MSDAENKRILVVSGEYAVVRQVRRALLNNGFAIQTAYSHRDGLYSLENGAFDAVLVDALMVNNQSGESTAAALAQVNQHVPVIALTPNGHLPTNVVSASSNEDAILHSLATALHLSTAAQGGFSVATGDYYGEVEEIEALFDLSKSLTGVLELSEVLNRVVEAARRLTNAEEGMILLPDEEGGQLFLRAKVGIDLDVARNFRVRTEDTLAGRVYGTGQPVLIGAQGPQKVKTEYLVNALLYVPILYEGKCIGVLGVNNRNTEAVFYPKHQELLMNLASFAAIAIENARVHEETVERTRELETLIEASNVLNSDISSLDQTLPNICEQLMRVLNVNLTEIYRWDRETNQLQTQARSFRTSWPTGQGPLLKLTDHPTLNRALENGQCVVIKHGHNLTSAENYYLGQLGVDSIQIIPVVGGDQTLGAVQVYYIHRPEKFPDTEILQRVQNTTLEVLVALSNQTNQARMQGIFRTVEEINRITGADWCELALYTPDRKALSVNLALGKGVWLTHPQPCLDLTHYPDLVEAILSQSLINKQGDSKMMTSGVRTLLDNASSRAILGLPLIQRGYTQGLVLFADVRRVRVFSQRDIDMGRALVGQAATALENASLVHDLEKSLHDLRDTQDRLVQTARLSAMGELAAAVAHQINNPLTTIMVDSEMMLLDEQPESRNYRSLQAISRAGKRAAGVARRLLAIARPNDPESPPERIDVIDTIEGVLSLVKAHIERDHIQIIPNMPEEKLPPVWAVPGQLDDIWLNLLLNAHDALIGREGAKMGISASYQQGGSAIEVIAWDNGPGIPTKIIDEIFRPFFTTKPVGEGTGLGLHICRQTAERIGGSISVESAPDAGTRFLVRLPVRQGD
jgi:signal transduction histidine kinase/CheY-like chemotaxis protein